MNGCDKAYRFISPNQFYFKRFMEREQEIDFAKSKSDLEADTRQMQMITKTSRGFFKANLWRVLRQGSLIMIKCFFSSEIEFLFHCLVS